MSGIRGSIGWSSAILLSLGLPALASPQEAAGLETRPQSIWRFELSGDGSWYENAYFLGPQLEDASWSFTGRATLSRERRFRTGSFKLSLHGGGIYYPEITGFNQPTYGGLFELGWRAGRRTTFTLSQVVDRTNTRLLNATDSAGLALPTSATTYATSTLSMEHKMSQYWAFNLDGRYELRDYDDPLLVSSDQVYANAGIGHQVGRRGQIYLEYGFTSSWLEGERLRAHQVLLGGKRKPPLLRGWGYELAGGAGYVESTDRFYPSARAGLNWSHRHGSFALLYHRDFGQAYGYGRQMIGDVASATINWALARKLSFSGGYDFVYRRDPLDESYTIRSSIASGGLNWTIGGGVAAGARYYWEKNVTQGLSTVAGSRATFSLSYGVDWK